MKSSNAAKDISTMLFKKKDECWYIWGHLRLRKFLSNESPGVLQRVLLTKFYACHLVSFSQQSEQMSPK